MRDFAVNCEGNVTCFGFFAVQLFKAFTSAVGHCSRSNDGLRLDATGQTQRLNDRHHLERSLPARRTILAERVCPVLWPQLCSTSIEKLLLRSDVGHPLSRFDASLATTSLRVAHALCRPVQEPSAHVQGFHCQPYSIDTRPLNLAQSSCALRHRRHGPCAVHGQSASPQFELYRVVDRAPHCCGLTDRDEPRAIKVPNAKHPLRTAE